MNKTQKTLSVAKSILIALSEFGPMSCPIFFPARYAEKYGYAKMTNNHYVSFNRLHKKGFIKKANNIYSITLIGKSEALFSLLVETRKSIQPEKSNKKWDKKWRIIFFDIPEKKRRYRDELRRLLRVIGFKEFQKSIWIYPYEIPPELRNILFEDGIKQYARLIVTDKIGYDEDLKRKFNITP